MSHHYMEGTEQEILPADTEFDGVPYVGCAATIHVGSDSYPATVARVSEKTVNFTAADGRKLKLPVTVELQECMFRRIDKNGQSEIQKYVYYRSTTPFDQARAYSWRPGIKNYVAVGTRTRSSAAQPPAFGYRRAYWDPTF
jgi:hypothetical protein